MELRLLRRPNLANLVKFVRGGRLGETTTRCEGSRGHDLEISTYARGLAGRLQGTDLGYAICTWGLA